MMPVEDFEALGPRLPRDRDVGAEQRQRPELRLYRARGLRVGGARNDRARPDGTLARVGRFAGDGEWSSPEHILMTRS
ncbi:hypothetical protein ACWGIT_03245 [Streptomyces cyaneofuscatus]